LVQAPGAYDAMSAFMVEKEGFPAVYLTGSGMSISLLGHPDLNTVSYLELKQKVENIRLAIDIPIIVDIDTGFGGPLNLVRLVKEFEMMDIAAIQIEDQRPPKKCGHELGRNLVSPREMCKRIQTIVDNRLKKEGIMIIARTDARTIEGIDAAIERANLYLDAGADMIFIESPESIEELKSISKNVKGKILFNNVEGGRSPFLSKETLESLGFNLVIYPNSLTRIVTKSMSTLLTELRTNGTTENLRGQMYTHRQLFDLFNYQEWVQLEDNYL
jgi:2-methylisocitrate lyase-like PEP mutase family enzyme